MPCYRPMKLFRAAVADVETGKRGLTGNPLKALDSTRPIRTGCGQCMGCRLDKADTWATRLSHEAQMHDESSFITLTYSDEHVPQDFSLKLEHWQLFMKRLRSRVRKLIRFCACGEYGEETFRPHYHALVFGYAFPDRTLFCERNGFPVWKSAVLEDLWPYGLSEIGSVEAESAGYVARYTTKKVVGAKADEHYFRVSPVDGVAYRRSPEFMVMSRRPGIGSTWFERFEGDALPSDFLVVNGMRKPVPKFYLDRYAKAHPGVEHPRPGYFLRDVASGGEEQVKRKRRLKAARPEVKLNNAPERLRVREEVARDRLKRLVRSL